MEEGLGSWLDAHRGYVIIGDDKRSDRCWACEPSQALDFLLTLVLADPAWSLQSNLGDSDLWAWQLGRTMLGLPKFLRLRLDDVKLSSDPVVPHVFGLVKSKCFLPDGTKVCTKLGHSCWRRVVGALTVSH